MKQTLLNLDLLVVLNLVYVLVFLPKFSMDNSINLTAAATMVSMESGQPHGNGYPGAAFFWQLQHGAGEPCSATLR